MEVINVGTRSEIGILNSDKTVTSIYCHWDGYPDYNGKILSEYYTNEKTVRELISNGDLSSLCENIKPNENSEHTFDKPQEDVCVYYYRDRGEPWEQVKPRTYKSIKIWRNEIKKGWQEYLYLFINGRWYFSSTYNKIKLKDLKKAITIREYDDSNEPANK